MSFIFQVPKTVDKFRSSHQKSVLEQLLRCLKINFLYIERKYFHQSIESIGIFLLC